MAGWSVTIVRQPAEDYPLRVDRAKVLANWYVGASGVRWIDRLVGSGDAKRVKSGGYPNLYTAPARAIVPLFAGDEPPHDEKPGSMFAPRQVSVERAGLDACAPDELLTIAVWDQS